MIQIGPPLLVAHLWQGVVGVQSSENGAYERNAWSSDGKINLSLVLGWEKFYDHTLIIRAL